MIEIVDTKQRKKKRPSMRAAINAKCKDCSYDPLDRGTWRQQVGACTDTECSLHPLRPMPETPLSPRDETVP